MKTKNHRKDTRNTRVTTGKWAVGIGGVLLLAVCWKAQGTFGRSETAQPSGETRFEKPIAPELPCSPIPTIAAGQWQIAGADWTFAVHHGTDLEVEAMLRHPPGGVDAQGTTNPEHLAVLELFQSRLKSMESPHGIQVYGADSQTLKLRVFSRSDPPALLGGYVSYPRGDAWTVLAITPTTSERAERAVSGLLPLPDTVRRICRRVGADARTQCDVVMIFGGVSQLAQYWRAVGWEVYRPRWAEEHGDILFCRRGDHLVQVTIQQGPEPHRTILILVSAEMAEGNSL